MRDRLFIAAGALLVYVGLGSIAAAHEQIFGDLRIAHPWVAAAGGDTHAAYGYAIEIENKGKSEERLIGASLEAAGEGALRCSRDENGVRKFTPVEKGLAIEPGKSIELAPGKMQIYFPNLKGALAEEGIAKGTLVFEKAGTLSINFMVEPASAAEPDVPAAAAGDQYMKIQQQHDHH